MIMHDFEYVPKEEWKPIRDELFEIIHRLQNEVRDDFTFQYHFVGSSKRDMITRDRKSNKGFDFDVNIEVNDPDEDYSAEEIRKILHKGLDKITNHYGYSIFGYDYTEDSTRVLTIKVKERANSRILHSCDFCIIYELAKDGNNIFAITKNNAVIRGNISPKGIMLYLTKLSGLKNINCGNKSEIIT